MTRSWTARMPPKAQLRRRRGLSWQLRTLRAAVTAVHNLHVYVANLRKIPSSGGVDPRAVLASKPGYRLNVPDSSCDLGRFATEKAAGVQAAAAGRFRQAGDRLAAALAQWRGPVLDDVSDFGFVQPFAAALVEDKVVAHVVRAESEIACGRSDLVIGELEELVCTKRQHAALQPGIAAPGRHVTESKRALPGCASQPYYSATPKPHLEPVHRAETLRGTTSAVGGSLAALAVGLPLSPLAVAKAFVSAEALRGGAGFGQSPFTEGRREFGR
jgi:hypothetical protein